MTAAKPKAPIVISLNRARDIWINAQRLNHAEPFGTGPSAVHRAIDHLGYVQIDVINVIERCHHHILFNRIPAYQRQDLHQAQSEQKFIFEFWTHALSYLPTSAYPYFVDTMKRQQFGPVGWGADAPPIEQRKVINRIKVEGPLSISDFKTDKLREKEHLWASKKPSKIALEAGFYAGKLTISERKGVEKFYDLTSRHFNWEKSPRAATRIQTLNYEIDRALTAQGIVTLDSICHLTPARKPETLEIIEKRVRAKKLIELRLSNDPDTRYFGRLDVVEEKHNTSEQTHILSPFDPLIIQRKRTAAIFDHHHIFEAYVPQPKRKWGYFTLPVLRRNAIIAGLDLKADRQTKTLLIQNWHWFEEANISADKALVEQALHKFAQFQFEGEPAPTIKGGPC